jgi:hypothetical protein
MGWDGVERREASLVERREASPMMDCAGRCDGLAATATQSLCAINRFLWLRTTPLVFLELRKWI